MHNTTQSPLLVWKLRRLLVTTHVTHGGKPRGGGLLEALPTLGRLDVLSLARCCVCCCASLSRRKRAYWAGQWPAPSTHPGTGAHHARGCGTGAGVQGLAKQQLRAGPDYILPLCMRQHHTGSSRW